MYNLMVRLLIRFLMALGMPSPQATSVKKLRPRHLLLVLYEAMLVAFGLQGRFRYPPLPMAGGANNKMLRGETLWKMDPLGPLVSTTAGFNGLCALGTGTNTLTRLNINGGGVRLTQDTNEAADMVYSGPLAYQLNKCGLLQLQARVRLNTTLTAGAFFVGLWDIVTTGQLSYEDAAVVSTPTDGVGVLYEQEQISTGAYYTIGTGNSVDDTVRLSTNIDVLVLATFVTIRIEIDNTNGSNGDDTTTCRFRVWIDGKLMETAATDARGWTTSLCRSSVVLAPVIGLFGRGTAHTFDIVEFECLGQVGDALD